MQNQERNTIIKPQHNSDHANKTKIIPHSPATTYRLVIATACTLWKGLRNHGKFWIEPAQVIVSPWRLNSEMDPSILPEYEAVKGIRVEKQWAPRGNCDMKANISILLENPSFPLVSRRKSIGIVRIDHPIAEVINVFVACRGHRKNVLTMSIVDSILWFCWRSLLLWLKR